MENMLTIGLIVYDGNYECIYNIYNQIQQHVKLAHYEVIIADNREKTKNYNLPDINTRVIDMNGNKYTLEARRAITENAYGNYVWLLDADDEICADIGDSFWVASTPDIYYLPTEVNSVLIHFDQLMPGNKPLSDSYTEEFGTFMWDKFFRKDFLQETYRRLPHGNIIFCEDDITNYMFIWIHNPKQISYVTVNSAMPIYKHNPNKYSVSLNTNKNSSITTIGSSEMLCFIYTIDPEYWAYLVYRASRFEATQFAITTNIWLIHEHLDTLYDFAKKYNKLEMFKNFI